MIGNIDILVKELCKLPKEWDVLSSNITIASKYDWPGQSNH